MVFDSRSSLFIVGLLFATPIAVAQTPEAATYRTSSNSGYSTEGAVASLRPTFPTLAPRLNSDDTAKTRESATASDAMSGPTVTVASSLAVVLGLFAAMIWMTRRFGAGANANRALPREAMEVLGTTTLQPRLNVSLVRIGTRVVVLAQTAQGVQTISEITDIDEANHLIATCRGEATVGFAKELKAMDREPYRPGFVEPTSEPTPRRRLFASA